MSEYMSEQLELHVARGEGIAAEITVELMTWSQLQDELLAEPSRSDLTTARYAELGKGEQTVEKCVRGYVVPAKFVKLNEDDRDECYASYRTKENVEAVCAAKLDVELDKAGSQRLARNPKAPRGNADPKAIVAALQGFELVIHPTRSSRPGDRRWRVFVPFLQPLPPDEAHRICSWMVDELEKRGIAVDRGSSTDVSRPAFLPTLNRDAEWHPHHVQGRAVGTEDVPADYVPGNAYVPPALIPAPNWEKVEIEKLDLPDKVKRIIIEGAEAHNSEGQRHRAIFSVCCAMLRAGYDTDTILRVIADPDYGISDKVLREWGHGDQKRGMAHVARSVLPAARNRVPAVEDMFDVVEGAEETILLGPELWEHHNREPITALFAGLDDGTCNGIREAAKLSPAAFDQQRRQRAKAVRMRVKTFTDLVTNYRKLVKLDGTAAAITSAMTGAAEPPGGLHGGDGGIADSVLSLLAKRELRFIHNADNECFALVNVDGHQEVLPLGEKASGMTDFRMRVQRIAKDAGIRYMPDEAWANIWGSVRSDALTDGDERPVNLRCATLGDRHYLDLCNSTWQVVEISASGWRVIEGKKSPVLFRRTSNMRPLPLPEAGGDVGLLWPYIAVPEAHRPLYLAVLLAMYRTGVPYPILALTGMEGSGKTTVARTTVELVDPKKAPTRGLPHGTQDLMVRAHNNYSLAMENVSSVGDDMSDALCRIATGSGDAGRSLYTNLDETVSEYQRPIILEGITFFLVRPDLIDRSVHLEIDPLPAKERKTESELKSGFEADKPKILGALLSLLAAAQARLPHVRIPEDADVRMVDFARLGQALCDVMDVKTNDGTPLSFVDYLVAVQKATRAHAMEGSPTTQALIRFMRNQYEKAAARHRTDPDHYPVPFQRYDWTGTPGELLDVLPMGIGDRGRYREGWVRSGKGMADLLRRYRKPLFDAGITVERLGHGRNGNQYHLTYKPPLEEQVPLVEPTT